MGELITICDPKLLKYANIAPLEKNNKNQTHFAHEINAIITLTLLES